MLLTSGGRAELLCPANIWAVLRLSPQTEKVGSHESGVLSIFLSASANKLLQYAERRAEQQLGHQVLAARWKSGSLCSPHPATEMMGGLYCLWFFLCNVSLCTCKDAFRIASGEEMLKQMSNVSARCTWQLHNHLFSSPFTFCFIYCFLPVCRCCKTNRVCW